MTETSASLLDAVGLSQDETAWKRFLAIYTPLIHSWLIKRGMLGADAEDVVQDVLAVVLQKIPDFQRQRTGSFRRWLRSVTVNCLRDFQSKRAKSPRGTGDSQVREMIEQLSDPHSGLSRVWDEEHDKHVLGGLLEAIRPEFADLTWKAFHLVSIEGVDASEAAEKLEITKNAVYIAKSRVLARLRELGKGLLD